MKIACIGNAVLDHYFSGTGNLIIDGRRNFDKSYLNVGGPSSTAASVIARFGNEVDFYGRVGNDMFGKMVYQKMNDEKINLNHLAISNEVETPCSCVIINRENKTRTIAIYRSKAEYNNPYIGFNNLESDYDYILTDGKYAEDTIELIKKNPQAVTIIDAGRINPGVLKLCNIVDYIICSGDFANGVTQMEITDDYEGNVILFNRMKQIFKNPKGITITIGGNGYICEKDNKVVINPCYKSGLPVVDTNGAGDIFHGAFTYAMANNYEYHDALEFANTTASLSVTKEGGRDSCPNFYEVEEVLNRKNYQYVKKIG